MAPIQELITLQCAKGITEDEKTLKLNKEFYLDAANPF